MTARSATHFETLGRIQAEKAAQLRVALANRRRSKEDREACRTAIAELRAMCVAVNLQIVSEDLLEVIDTLQFYSSPETYFAIAFLSDPPAGEFLDDFSVVEDPCGIGGLVLRPGKRARAALARMDNNRTRVWFTGK